MVIISRALQIFQIFAFCCHAIEQMQSIVDCIQVFTLLAQEKVCSAVALDAGLTAKILQILQTLTRNFFSGFSIASFLLTNRGSVLSANPSLKL